MPKTYLEKLILLDARNQQIRALRKSGVSATKVAAQFRISRQRVEMICSKG